jgi:putative (di)nucleoside polyphosphate hydrolase
VSLDPAGLPYRPCVGVMLANRAGQVFVGQRIDTREGDRWQMPQGGIDPGEDIEAAAFRELREETGVGADLATIVATAREEQLYDLPIELLGKLWGGQYRGQRQTWVLMRFAGEDADIDLAAHDPPEFLAWKWVAPEDLPGLIVPFKRRVYEAVVREFAELI